MWSERSVAMAKWIVDWYDDTVTCSECGAREDAFVTRSAYGGEWAVDGKPVAIVFSFAVFLALFGRDTITYEITVIPVGNIAKVHSVFF